LGNLDRGRRRIILKWILMKEGVGMWTDSSGSGYGPVTGYWEHINKPSGSIKGG
jgi:hypothetical protein